ncbi:GlxA family transcriptional regulator [Pontibaca methylaminivorans]|uniref:Transcriptional regulator GlxA family, contains an amidase domain and an AraC-type DNA-binding HTH domain n=1 Tax=Pontibaca methylaminivorans TaxID=515897 RepID=A0A1R3WVY5_9RHOB|nr:GlxA family transcriptional regulator [Pontibaca methylaminivorans]SIT82303.1 Transcriptional regulator GlxA family, contains an amidase domain and an AraC-type DNA-binding HTH domain [Pontibaca methylaminivorans]
MTGPEKSTTLGFLIFPGFPMACLTSAIEPLRAANEIAGRPAFGWHLISERGDRVRSSAEVGFDPDLALAEAEGLDYLFLLSSPRSRFDDPKASDGLLRRFARHGVRMGGISGGVFPLARSGLLAGHECSVHWCYEAAFAAEFPDHRTTDDVIRIDRQRYTVSGAAAAFDLMLHLIEEKLGNDVTTEVACWFQHPLVRGLGVRQKIPTAHGPSTADMLPTVVARAAEIFADHIEDPLAVSDVADLIGVSSRQLERSFKQATGQSPSHYYRSLRMNAARQLVLYSRDSMTEIANAVGYATAAPMLRHYHDAFGLSPKEDRETINMFRVRNNRSIPST